MAISTSDLKILLQKSGNRCAFPNCGKILTNTDTESDETVILSNIAHIVAQKEDGPRGKFALPVDQRDCERNLILLCSDHHKQVDDLPQTYSVERLRGFKEDHEKKIEGMTAIGINTNRIETPHVTETIFSTLFEVVKLPTYVYFSYPKYNPYNSPTFSELHLQSTLFLPFSFHNGNLLTFQDPSDVNSAFHNLVDLQNVKRESSRQMWNDPVRMIWYIELLNKAFKSFMDRQGLHWDAEHNRYFFAPDIPGEVKDVAYKPLNQNIVSKHVVWRPITKKTGQPKRYWLHRALSTRFFIVSTNQWCISFRPEFRVTTDGVNTLPSEKVGAKITKKKSRMFNYDLLGEVNFWRSYLSNNEPRIIIDFGNSQLIIHTAMLSCEVTWPGIPMKYSKSFSNIEYADDLFTWSKLQQLQEEDIETEDWDEEGGDIDE
jgi:hypothetical protein